MAKKNDDVNAAAEEIVSQSGRVSRHRIRKCNDQAVLRKVMELEQKDRNRVIVIGAAESHLRKLEKENGPEQKEFDLEKETEKNEAHQQDPPKKTKKKKRDWPKCTDPGCDKNVYMPSGSAKLCYQHYLESGGKPSPLVKAEKKSGTKKDPKVATKKPARKKVQPKAPAARKPKSAFAGANVEQGKIPDVKVCPKCSKKAKGEKKIGELFGFRNMKSKRADGTEVTRRVAQSQCRECRSKAAKAAAAKKAS
jgi:hypothetical protein